MLVTRRNATGLKFSPFKMLPKILLAAILFQLFVQSDASTTVTTVMTSLNSSGTATVKSPPSTSTVSNGTTSPSMGSTSQTSGADASNALSTNTVTSTVTFIVTSTVTSTVWGGLTVSPTWVVNPTPSVPYVEWEKWQKPSNCKERCCETGGPFIRQTRNCTIHRMQCNLSECIDYGPTERETSCYTACSECMPNTGYIMAASRLITITAATFISAIFVARP